MALGIDASTPAFVSGADPWVSASFTPPNDSLLVVKVSGDWFGGTPTIAVTSTGLTFTQAARFGALNEGLAEIWIAKVGSNGGTSRTVSVDTSIGSNTGGAKVEVWTDFRTSVPVDAVFGGANVTTNNFTANLTTGHDGCWVTGVGTDWQNLGAATSTDTHEHGEPTGVACLVVRKSAATATAGAETLNFDAAGTGTPLWTWAALSIAPSTAPDPLVWYIGAGSPVAGTTSITTAAYPADWAAGDKIICTVASNHATTEATEPTVSGFTQVGTLNGGGGTQGVGTGNRRLTIFERDAQSGDDTTPTVSLSGGNVMIAQFTAYRTSETWSACTAVFGADTTAASSLSAAGGSNLDVDAGDMVELAYVVRDTSAHSAQAITATGSTFSTVTERAELSSETGNDISLSVANATVLTGPSSAAPTISCTLSTSETGVVGAVRIRAVASGADVTPSTVSAAVAIPAPTVIANADATATPSVVVTTAAVPSAVVLIGKYITDIAGTGTGQHFVDQAGDPILVRGYVLWGLLMNAGRWAGTWQSDLEDAVDALQAMGCNALYTEPLGNTQNGGAFNNGNTWDSVAPFTGGDPATFNNTFWQRSDYLFDLCEAAGITVFFNFAYSDDLDTAALSAFSTADFTDYGTSLAARYKTRPNLVWMMGGDYFDTDNTAITAVKTAIRAEGDTHLFGVQNYPETTSRKDIENNATEDTGTDNSEFNFVYSYNAIYWGIEYAWTESSPLPVMWGDGHFDQDTTADRKVMRDLTWWTFSSGGRGMIYGSEGTWAWASGALANLTSDIFPNTDMDGIQNLFAGFTNWHHLVPDTDSSFVTAGRGTKSDYVTSSGGGGGEYNSSDTQAPYVTASITADGTLAVVYFPVDQTITVDDTELNAGYTVTWVDPISGATTSETPASTYSPTGTNSLGGADWLLVFESAFDPNATVTPSTVNAAGTVPAATVLTGSTANPATVGTAASIPTPSVSTGGGASVTAVAVTATAGVPVATVQTGSVVTAASVATATGIPSPTVQTSGNATVTAATVSGSVTVPALTVQAGTTPAPVIVSAVGQVPAATVTTGSTPTPGVVAATAAVPTPAVSAGGSAGAAPSTVSATAGIPAPALTTGSRIAVTTVTAPASIPAPSVSAGSSVTASPPVVVAAAVIPAPGVRLGAEPATVTGVAAIPIPTLSTSALVPSFSVSSVATIPAPTVFTFVPVTLRPNAGTTTRPSGGTTPRPNTGTTARP